MEFASGLKLQGLNLVYRIIKWSLPSLYKLLYGLGPIMACSKGGMFNRGLNKENLKKKERSSFLKLQSIAL